MKWREERKSYDSVQRVNEILNGWDPIGVADLVSDEYEMYISSIMLELDKNSGEEAIYNLLVEIVEKRICLSADKGKTAKAANLLVSHWAQYAD